MLLLGLRESRRWGAYRIFDAGAKPVVSGGVFLVFDVTPLLLEFLEEGEETLDDFRGRVDAAVVADQLHHQNTVRSKVALHEPEKGVRRWKENQSQYELALYAIAESDTRIRKRLSCILQKYIYSLLVSHKVRLVSGVGKNENKVIGVRYVSITSNFWENLS